MLQLLRGGVKGILSLGREPAAGPTRPHILVVDDEPAIRTYLCESLAEQASYRCSGASGPRDAMNLARADAIDVALLAHTMSPDAGFALARQMRDELPDLPVVLITGTQSFDAAVEAMRIGIFDYLLAPFEMSELFDAIERAAAWRRDALRGRRNSSELHRQIAEKTSHLSQTFLTQAATPAALNELLGRLNQRSPEALAHARRVSKLSVPVAASLGIGQPTLSIIEQGALLHDLGKIAIPDEVMFKAGPLTAAEFAIMRSHPQIGYDIAVRVPFLRSAAELILTTHEWYDGSGYPRGLLGESIPMGARVIAAVDAFDALTFPHLHRDPVSIDRANAELVRGAGSQFDPDVVAAWLQYLDRYHGKTTPWDAEAWH